MGLRRLENSLNEAEDTGDRTETLPIPYAVVAADLHSGEEVILRDCDVVEAIRASIAIPGLFTPLRRHGPRLPQTRQRAATCVRTPT